MEKETPIVGRPLNKDQKIAKAIKERPDLNNASIRELQVNIVQMEDAHEQDLAAKDKTIERLKKKLSNKIAFKKAATGILKTIATPFNLAGRGLSTIGKSIASPTLWLSYATTGPLANYIHLKMMPDHHATRHGYSTDYRTEIKEGISKSYSKSNRLALTTYGIPIAIYVAYNIGSSVLTSWEKSYEADALIQNHIVAEMKDIPCHPDIGDHELMGLNICTPYSMDGFSYQSNIFPDVKGEITHQTVNRLLMVKPQEQVDGRSFLHKRWRIKHQDANTPIEKSNFNVKQEDIEEHPYFCWKRGDKTYCHVTNSIETNWEKFHEITEQDALEPTRQ